METSVHKARGDLRQINFRSSHFAGLAHTATKLILATFVAGLLAACAQPASAPAMIPDLGNLGTRQPAAAFREAISAAPVSGGKETSPAWASQIGNAALQEALVETLIRARLARTENGRFRLEAKMLTL